MLSIQQLIKALRRLQNTSSATSSGSGSGGDLIMASVKHVVASTQASTTEAVAYSPNIMTSLSTKTTHEQLLPTPQQQQKQQANISSQQLPAVSDYAPTISLDSYTQASGSTQAESLWSGYTKHVKPSTSAPQTQAANNSSGGGGVHQRSQQIQNFYQQHLHHFHTQHNQNLCAKQKQTQFAMSSLAAEPISTQLKQEDNTNMNANKANGSTHNGTSCGPHDQESSAASQNKESSSAAAGKPCFNTGLGEIIKFMELIGNLKHTKRTGWVLRDVNDCESISGHMYRMSMMTFLLDGTEGLNQIRCMELALVHDLAESLVGDITPFCGVTKTQKRAMEFKAMEDICKLIEPRGKRIMELFEEYETGESAESKFVKDLDRLDMVMQAFEYEKRDNCLLKHQEFFDSTEGKFKHPFVKKLVNEIYEQRRDLARATGATPPPPVHVPDMEEEPLTNGHAEKQHSNSTTSS